MIHSLPQLPILLLILASLAMIVLRLLRPRFAYFWLVAGFGALLGWTATFLLGENLSLYLPLTAWQPESLLPVSPALLVDGISWAYALAIATLVLAVILTDVARATEADWSTWSSSLVIGSLGLFAVLSGNALTLLLAWAGLDLVELIILLNQVHESKMRERVVLTYTARLAGILLLSGTTIYARARGVAMDLRAIPPEMSLYLLLASGLRLGILPLHAPFLHEPPVRRGLGTILRLVPTTASLVLVTRTAQAGIPISWTPYLLLLAGIAGLFGSLAWANAENELDGRPYWILAGASLSIASAVRGQAEASLAFGVATILSGSLLFLSTTRHRRLLPLLWLGLLAFSTLPFTPSWPGVLLYAPPLQPLLLVFLIVQAIMIAGYWFHSMQFHNRLGNVERWVWLIYPWGLFLLPASAFLYYWWSATHGAEIFPAMSASWPAAASLLIAGLLSFLSRRGMEVPPGIRQKLYAFFSFGWLYRLLWELFQLFGRGLRLGNQVLEGEGGILWTFLLLALLLSLFVQFGWGG